MTVAPAVRERGATASEALARALDRAGGTRPIGGNVLSHLPDSLAALEAMLARIAAARAWIHLENYIIRGDHTGRRFAAALAERARAGVRVRVLYDALGSLGTPHRYWRGLRQAGVTVRAFHPILTTQPLDLFTRDHRKLLVVDGETAVTGGLCIGDEWAGHPRRRRLPWRDTMVEVRGPAAAVLDRGFGRVWRHCGPPLPPDELAADPAARGDATVRVVEGLPGRARVYRMVQLLAAAARERLWITDAYLVAPAPLLASLIDAARDGVDVRLLVPSTSDVPIVRDITRAGYRELLRGGIRVYEWRGPMLHAKTMLADRTWGRVGSSNLNVSSLITNYELDILADDPRLCDALDTQFRRDLAHATEVVLRPRRRLLPAKLVREPAPPEGAALPPHKRSGYELGTVAVVALRRVAGGLRRTLATAAALLLLVVAVLFLVFPGVTSVIAAVVALWLAAGLGLSALQRRRFREEDDAP